MGRSNAIPYQPYPLFLKQPKLLIQLSHGILRPLSHMPNGPVNPPHLTGLPPRFQIICRRRCKDGSEALRRNGVGQPVSRD